MVLSKFANKSFFTRLLSGIVLVALMLATIIPGGNILFVANLLISVVGVYELYKVLGIEKNSLGITGYIAVLAYYAVLYFDKKEYMMILMVVFLMCLLAQYVFMFPKYKTEQISNAIMSMLYAGVMLSYLYSVREGNNGAYTVWLIFLCSWGSDTCAYLAGVAFGKHKMAPVLSPKKSVEGAVGGVVGAAALGAIYATIFSSNITMSINPVAGFAIICAQIDNALEACMKIPKDAGRNIKVEIWQKESFVFFKVINTALKNPFIDSKELRTTKESKDSMHGFGIKNIKETAAKYDGTLKNDYIDGCFISLVMISNHE